MSTAPISAQASAVVCGTGLRSSNVLAPNTSNQLDISPARCLKDYLTGLRLEAKLVAPIGRRARFQFSQLVSLGLPTNLQAGQIASCDTVH